MSELKKGDYFTVEKWINTSDISYIGDIFQVCVIELPFISASRHSGYFLKDKIVFSLNEVNLKKLSNEFVDSVVPGLINPFRASKF